jgi:PAS domain S-box-containing protein
MILSAHNMETFKRHSPLFLSLITSRSMSIKTNRQGKGSPNTKALKVVKETMHHHDGPVPRFKKSDIKQLEGHLTVALEASHLGVWEWDMKADKVIWAEATIRILGFCNHEFAGNLEAYVNGLHPDDRDEVLQTINTAVAAQGGFHLEHRWVWPDKSLHWIECFGKVIKDKEGNSTYLTGTVRDITGKKLVEQERKEAEQKIRQQNTKLLSLTEELVRKNNQLEEFTHIVSHNLRSPVSNIVTLLSLLENAKNEEEEKQYLNFIKQSSSKTQGMLDDLNEVLKIKQEKNIVKSELRFKEILDQVKIMLNAKVTQHAANVVHDFSQAETIQYPTIYLESIVLNLLDNALKYSRPDTTPRISFKTYFNENAQLILEVSDNGLGIDMEKFSQYVFKLRHTFHKHPESRGIGLFLVKNQIEAMGGEITLTSEENKGSTFFINFSKNLKED